MITVTVQGHSRRALIDTGCSNTMIRAGLVEKWTGDAVQASAFDGRTVECKGTAQIEMEVDGEKVSTRATVIDHIVGGIDVLIGMDVIRQLGGVSVGQHKIQFGKRVACLVVGAGVPAGEQTCQREELVIHDKDFDAKFDGKVWTVRYFWKGAGQGTPNLKNRVALYDRGLDGAKREKFEQEVEQWIEEGILVPWEGEEGGVIPLLAVEQPTKNKVRPVLDFRELNELVECHTGDELIDVCADTLREWRRVSGETQIVDLKAAYLQIRVSPELWRFQLVRFKGQTYCLTRLGFGLNCAPRIMTKVLKTVLSQSQEIQKATSSYIDDILVDVSVVSAEDVISHLKSYGLEAKPAVQLEGGSALGLKLTRDENGSLVFGRNTEVPKVDRKLSKRELFSICGKLVGHYPVAGWARLACSFVKRQVEGTGWDDYVGDRAQSMIEDVVNHVAQQDPVGGKWKVDRSNEGVVWCDASEMAMGVIVEIDGVQVEDGAWMRKSGDFHHINVAELEAVLKGINLGVKWGLQRIVVLTDSATVCRWIKMTLSEERRIKTSGAAEILIKRRLATLKALVEELGLAVDVRLVASRDNKADKLTRVPRSWMRTGSECNGSVACVSASATVKQLHDKHHMGVERTWYLAKKVDPQITKEQVKRVVKNCERCSRIDPAPGVHDVGELGVCGTWERLAIDITHYRGVPFLTMVDCGPGRFVIWRRLRGETAQHVIDELRQVFHERGPVGEVLLDNATAFRSEQFVGFLRDWNVNAMFRAAYRPSGNGIVERNHRTIKAMAERGDISPLEAVYYYNCSPRREQHEDSIPHRSVMTYEWRQPDETPAEPECGNSVPTASFSVGEEVWVKPGNAKCTSEWGRGVVTKVNSTNNIEVDNMPRHVLDLRPIRGEGGNAETGGDALNEGERGGEPEERQENDRRYPQRARRAPLWQDNYVLG